MGLLRIVAGERKGQRLRVPTGEHVRPTSERLREAVFSMLLSRLGGLEGAEVLDLFAGTGALGLEALSRGAAHCTFVESHRSVIPVLRGNIAGLDYEGKADVLAFSYERALAMMVRQGLCYDLLFVDPPYRMLADVSGRLAPVLPQVLRGAGLAVIEGPKGVAAEVGVPVLFQRRYGDTLVTVVGREEATT
jgi:16S rRNA (guanine966-N2)-methyltransferase